MSKRQIGFIPGHWNFQTVTYTYTFGSKIMDRLVYDRNVNLLTVPELNMVDFGGIQRMMFLENRQIFFVPVVRPRNVVCFLPHSASEFVFREIDDKLLGLFDRRVANLAQMAAGLAEFDVMIQFLRSYLISVAEISNLSKNFLIQAPGILAIEVRKNFPFTIKKVLGTLLEEVTGSKGVAVCQEQHHSGQHSVNWGLVISDEESVPVLSLPVDSGGVLEVEDIAPLVTFGDDEIPFPKYNPIPAPIGSSRRIAERNLHPRLFKILEENARIFPRIYDAYVKFRGDIEPVVPSYQYSIISETKVEARLSKLKLDPTKVTLFSISRSNGFRTLSNLAVTPFEFQGKLWLSSETVYQSLKLNNYGFRMKSELQCKHPVQVMNAVREITGHLDCEAKRSWEQRRLGAMIMVLLSKFKVQATCASVECIRALLLTMDGIVKEATKHPYWGADKNMMGKALMIIRLSLQERFKDTSIDLIRSLDVTKEESIYKLGCEYLSATPEDTIKFGMEMGHGLPMRDFYDDLSDSRKEMLSIVNHEELRRVLKNAVTDKGVSDKMNNDAVSFLKTKYASGNLAKVTQDALTDLDGMSDLRTDGLPAAQAQVEHRVAGQQRHDTALLKKASYMTRVMDAESSSETARLPLAEPLPRRKLTSRTSSSSSSAPQLVPIYNIYNHRNTVGAMAMDTYAHPRAPFRK